MTRFRLRLDTRPQAEIVSPAMRRRSESKRTTSLPREKQSRLRYRTITSAIRDLSEYSTLGRGTTQVQLGLQLNDEVGAVH